MGILRSKKGRRVGEDKNEERDESRPKSWRLECRLQPVKLLILDQLEGHVAEKFGLAKTITEFPAWSEH